jgi:hypothetical protein
MLFFTLGLNFVVPQMTSQSPAFGMGGGGAPEILSAEEAPALPEAAATEAPAAEAPVEEPAIQMVPLPTQTLSTTDSAREMETASAKEGVVGDAPAADQSQVQNTVPTAPRPVPPTWQIVLAAIALLSALIMVIMRQAAASRWRR